MFSKRFTINHHGIPRLEGLEREFPREEIRWEDNLLTWARLGSRRLHPIGFAHGFEGFYDKAEDMKDEEWEEYDP